MTNKRLTKKDKYGHFYTNQANCRNIWSLDDKKFEGEYFENKTLAIDGEAIDKLGLLENIEEKLGISLIEAKEDLDVLYLLDELGIIDELIIDTLNCGNHYHIQDFEWKILYRWYQNHREEKDE